MDRYEGGSNVTYRAMCAEWRRGCSCGIWRRNCNACDLAFLRCLLKKALGLI